MLRHKNIKIFGKVQGVFYRDFVKNQASGLGVTGFVRNEPDGTVYIEAEEEEDALQKFISIIRKAGPPEAIVTNMEIEDAPLKNFDSFRVIF